MLLGIPGDNTYSNMAEAQRIFWRTTVVPLVQRTATALSNWLQAAFDPVPVSGLQSDTASPPAPLELRPDLDQLEALSPERDALWTRLEKTTFLTDDEKRALIGYAPKAPAPKFNPGQLRVPGGQSGGGRWTNGSGGGTVGSDTAGGDGGDSVDVGASDGTSDASGNVTDGANESDGSEAPQLIQDRRRFGLNRDRQLEGQLADTANRAQRAIDRVRELDPKWEPPQSFLPRDGNIEPRIQHQEMMLRAAETRLAEITRDAVPGTNPSWGVNRLTKELYDQGYRLERPTDAPGFLYRNPTTDEQVRIMERPMREWRTDPPEKHYFDYYYRYRENQNVPYRSAIPIPNKN